MSKIIKLIAGNPQVIEDDWQVVRGPVVPSAQNGGRMIFPFNVLKAPPGTGDAKVRAVWIAPDDEFEAMVAQLLELDLIAVDFPQFRDGRGYSIATMLRTRYGWGGELRAIGDVLRDQLNFMRRCGFDAFAVRADKDIDDATLGFSRYSVAYQGAAGDATQLLSRRQG
jgi:uncharacterized protein (DUF934 family)